MAAVSIRYARAFAELVFAGKLDAPQTARQLQDVAVMLADNPALREVWENPAVPAEQKRAVLAKIAAKTGMPRLLRDFVAVIIDHRRVAQLDEIAARFEGEVSGRMGIEDAEITSARELSSEERRTLEKQISALTGKQARASYKTDRGLLGGAVVRVSSTVYDGSVRGQLRKLKEQMLAGASV